MVISQKHTDQWNRVESPHTYSQLIFDKAVENIQ